jgi:hypothetical protein
MPTADSLCPDVGVGKEGSVTMVELDEGSGEGEAVVAVEAPVRKEVGRAMSTTPTSEMRLAY